MTHWDCYTQWYDNQEKIEKQQKALGTKKAL